MVEEIQNELGEVAEGVKNSREMEIQCVTCNAAGVIPTEEPSKGLTCPNCGGSGSKIVTMIPFTGRVLAEGIKVVFRDGRSANGISYDEFLAGERP